MREMHAFNVNFYERYEPIIIRQLNNSENRVNINMQDKNNQRTIADKIQNKTELIVKSIFSNGYKYIEPKSVRSMDDFSILKKGETLIADIKTRNVNKDFSMPNITSIKRLFDLLSDNKKTFGILNIEYFIRDDYIEYKKINFIP